jgi:Response regulators consisting of a CheY-like receiver domain and a winged-helix DNA-binding domain
MKNKILLVEDNLSLALTLKAFFEDNGLWVFHTRNGGEAFALYQKEQPDLVLLDIVLPGKDGFEILDAIKSVDQTLPVILMTGTEFSDECQIRGYDSGALNYLKKPILPKIALSLIQNLLSLPKNLRRYHIGNYVFQLHSQNVEINNVSHDLRDRDAVLLNLLLDRVNQTVPRTTILQQVWPNFSIKKNNSLDVVMSRLKKLLKPYPDIQIKTVYGDGYILRVGDSE